MVSVERKRDKHWDNNVQGDVVHDCRLPLLKNVLTLELSRPGTRGTDADGNWTTTLPGMELRGFGLNSQLGALIDPDSVVKIDSKI